MVSSKLRVIIVEGIDKSGKSTFVELLSKKYPGILLKITDRPSDGTEAERDKIKKYYSSVLDFIRDNPDKLFLLDRFFWSERVYSIKRGYDAIDDRVLLEMENFLSRIPHLVVYCMPGERVLQQRLEKEPDDYIEVRDVSDLIERYEKILENSPLSAIKINSNQNSNKMLEEVEQKINQLTKPL